MIGNSSQERRGREREEEKEKEKEKKRGEREINKGRKVGEKREKWENFVNKIPKRRLGGSAKLGGRLKMSSTALGAREFNHSKRKMIFLKTWCFPTFSSKIFKQALPLVLHFGMSKIKFTPFGLLLTRF